MHAYLLPQDSLARWLTAGKLVGVPSSVSFTSDLVIPLHACDKCGGQVGIWL